VALRLYNTRTRTKEDFAPLDPNKGVRMYVCGPTVYDYAHIGNARPVIVFDVLYRLLRHLYGPENVTYARNITDVDDKINARAAEEGVPIRELTERTTAQFHADMAALGCLAPNYEPRATDYVRRDDGQPDMIGMIQQLIDKGCAYQAEGHVLFDVSAWPDYGSLSRRPLDEMRAGARVEVAPYKRGPMDFVLWKPSKEGEPGWDSPWGRGRPGWHLECSTMSAALLGETFDIHGGGIDLQFPHHENEVAQSCCANRTDIMANIWMHNGYLMVEGEKMSKSLGNFITVRELFEGWAGHPWPGEAIRFNMLRTHYRDPIDWTATGLDESHKILWKWANDTQHISAEPIPHSQIVSALQDDLNTPAMITQLHNLYKKKELEALKNSMNFLGFSLKVDALLRSYSMRAEPGKFTVSGQPAISNHNMRAEPGEFKFSGQDARLWITRNDGSVELDEQSQAWLNEQIQARNEARKARNFAEADRIRDELSAMGIQLKDSRDPETGEITTTWEIAR